MKVLLNPIIISLLLAIIAVVSLILIYLITQEKLKPNLLNLEEGFTFVVMTLLLVGDSQSYVGNLSLQYLSDRSENRNAPAYVFIQFMAYIIAIFVTRSRVHYFIKAIIFLVRDPFLVGLLVLTVLSSFWSQTPLDTFKASLVLLVLVLYSSIIAVRCNFQELTKYLRYFGAWVAISSALLQILLPSLLKNDKGGWQGIAGHPNTLGYVMALTTILWGLNAIDLPKKRWRSISMAMLAFTVMVLTNSSGTLITFVVLVCLSLLFRMLKHLDFRQIFTAVPFFFAIGIPSSLLLIINKSKILGIFGKDENLTGRGDFWPAILAAIQQRISVGYGYHGFWQSWRSTENPAAHIRTINFVPTHSHNGFLELALALGLAGVGLFAFSLIRNIACTLAVMYDGKTKEAEISLLFIAFVIYSNLSEPGLWDVGYHVILYTILSTRLGIEVAKINLSSKHLQKASYNYTDRFL